MIMKFKKKILIIIGIIIIGLLIVGILFILKNSDKLENILSFVVSTTKNLFKSDGKSQFEFKNQLEQEQQNYNSDSNTKRYFLSKIELDVKEKKYSPVLIKCLYDEKGNQLYQQWAGIYYPDNAPYEVVIIKVEFDKKTSLNLNDTCFIQEIITNDDWEMVKAKYNFSKEKFGK